MLVSSKYDIVRDELGRTRTDAAVTYSVSPICQDSLPVGRFKTGASGIWTGTTI